MPTFTRVGLDALLTPENCVVLLIDHQPSQLANVNSHEPTMVINNESKVENDPLREQRIAMFSAMNLT